MVASDSTAVTPQFDVHAPGVAETFPAADLGDHDATIVEGFIICAFRHQVHLVPWQLVGLYEIQDFAEIRLAFYDELDLQILCLGDELMQRGMMVIAIMEAALAHFVGA